ncbi:MAG: homoserine kinase [Saprospiraceae bacterium]|nr:homoserine kinase [Saprospiraceae bacterium]
MAIQTIKAFAPATVANVAVGFDILGFAIDGPGDEVVLEVSDEFHPMELTILGDDGQLPLDPDKNTVSIVIKLMMDRLGIRKGVKIQLTKKMPLKSGMGSSAASSVVGAFALNALLGNPLSKSELLPLVMEGERAACGAAHADNVAPCLFGGLILVRSYEPLEVLSLPMPGKLICTLVHPEIDVPTSISRAVLPPTVLLKNMIRQTGNLAAFISALYTENYELLGRAIRDFVIEPNRAKLIPGFYEAQKEAFATGALGCSISGSGPSIFALSDDMDKAQTIGLAIRDVFKKQYINSEIFVSQINAEGPRIL